MSKTGILTLMVLFLSLHDARGNPLSSHDVGVNNELNRNSKSFVSNLFGGPNSHSSWMLPIPSLPFINLFEDDTNDMTVLMDKVETMEKNLESILKLLTQLTEDDRVPLREDERRWNTPPELIPEEVIKGSNAKNGRSLSIPITANINLNTGNNAHSLGFQVGPEGLSYSESNSFNHPLISQSQAASLAVGPSGVSGSTAQAIGQHYPINNNQGHANSQSLGVTAAASSSASVQNGQITSSATSSVNSPQSSASSNAGNTGRAQGTKIRFPGQNNRYPVWTNIRPNNNNGRRPPTQPKLEIDVKPNRGRPVQNGGPIVLEITSHPTQQPKRRPMVHVRKWHPSDRAHYDDK